MRSFTASAIDLKTGKVIATITSSKEKSHTRGVLVDETTLKLYVMNMSDVWVVSFERGGQNIG
jgi:DNA-binding beta-propeller fold protein YncE